MLVTFADCVYACTLTYFDLIPVYDRVSFGPDVENNNNMEHPCNVSKLQKYKSFYGHRVKMLILSKLDHKQVELV